MMIMAINARAREPMKKLKAHRVTRSESGDVGIFLSMTAYLLTTHR